MGPCSLRRRFPALALTGCLVLLPAALLFQRACDEERVTAELIARLAAFLRRKG